MPSKRTPKRGPQPAVPETNPFAQVERFAEELIDICAAERRLLETLARTQRAKASLVSHLADFAASATRDDLERRLREAGTEGR